ncbi:hypothetical protein DCS_07779 [Drechmeria coniospora]|uniref:Uncharacterized protein n=1 Tax=Drechmeria coniospora TaxID=98403 RepID=A0A151GFD6_DRECN|nr:hypothetical protein DCS_07779 [Drechmeria coniospora]KYK55815.1 hypothetical protein DCS_07779 [Drechmeria coniospora]
MLAASISFRLVPPDPLLDLEKRPRMDGGVGVGKRGGEAYRTRPRPSRALSEERWVERGEVMTSEWQSCRPLTIVDVRFELFACWSLSVVGVAGSFAASAGD